MKNLSVRWERASVAPDVAGVAAAECRSGGDGVLALTTDGALVEWSPGEEPIELGRGIQDACRCSRLLDFPDDASVLLAFATSSGEQLWRARLSPTFSLEPAGEVSGGVLALERSPDEELLALVGGLGVLVLMTSELDPLAESSLFQEGFGRDSFVNVGWGSKRTQFHGSLGKKAALADEESPDGKVLEKRDEDGLHPCIAWRDDGELLAVSYVEPGQRSRVRVFDRRGTLLTTSECLSGLEKCLCWRPSPSLIASSLLTMHSKKREVIFLEKNGLRHGEFPRPFQTDQVTTHLAFSPNSDVLMVCSRSNGSSCLQVFTCSNYHWCLKLSWTTAGDIVHAAWDKVDDLRIHLLTSSLPVGARYSVIQLGWQVHCSSDKNALVAVVDGGCAKLTLFKDCVIPPPLCGSKIFVPSNIRQVCFSPGAGGDSSEGNLCLVTENNDFYFFGKMRSHDEKSDGAKVVEMQGGGGFSSTSSQFHPVGKMTLKATSPSYNWCWMTGDNFLASTCDSVTLYHRNERQMEEVTSFACESVPCDIARDYHGSVAAIALDNGAILKYCSGDNSLQLWSERLLPSSERLEKMSVVKVASEYLVLRLTNRHRLYLDDRELCGDIRSFVTHSDFLLATTLKHELKCLPLESLLEKETSRRWSAESVRAVERGSRLVTVVPGHSKTVLQMPRGNLEVIYPRALNVHLIKAHLTNSNYKTALGELRKHRINLNLIVDHDPVLFLENVDRFVEQVAEPTRLCLFIAELSVEDCTMTAYRSSYSDRSPYQNWPVNSNKVETVCKRLLQALEEKGSEDLFILPIISCLVKGSDVSEALKRINVIRSRNVSLAEEALHFLLLLVDVNVLFDVALGLYDFDIVLFVAEKSQKDPKEFLPFLNDLKRLLPDYRKYKIDVHLKRHSQALRHICNASTTDYDEECLELIRVHKLYREALKVFPETAPLYQEICRSYGNYLTAKKYHGDAALIFERAGLTSLAIEAWERALDWRSCLSLVQKSGEISQPEMTRLCSRLAQKLKEEHRFKDAAAIFFEYLDSAEDAADALVQGQVWTEARRVIARSGREDLFETHLIPGVRSHGQSLVESVCCRRKMLSDQFGRLQQVLEMRNQIQSQSLMGDNHHMEEDDLYSDTTSTVGSVRSGKASNPASLQTRNTQRSKSSKNRRKNEKKKYSTREGSDFEDIGLIASLHDQICTTYNSTDEVGEVLRELCKIHEFSMASSLQKEYGELVDYAGRCVASIWTTTPSSDRVKYGPQATAADIISQESAASSAGYTPPWHLLDPRLRYPPAPPKAEDTWKLVFLSPD